jgi:hypothetical protein
MFKKVLMMAVMSAVVAAFAASSAFAGESTGNFGSTTSQGKNNTQTPIGQPSDTDPPHAASICSFSGQNPEAFLPPTDPDYEPGRTQSWGQIPKAVRDTLPAEEHPGSSCNGHTGFFAGGGSE